MITAKHHIVIYPFFKWLTRLLLKSSFNSIELHSDFTDQKKGILAIANHTSWWDGFWVEYLNQKITRRKFHFMMLEKQLKKHWYFRYAGGYSVKTKSKEITDSLSYTLELLKNDDNIVLMFPQGKIHSAHNNSIHFKKGIQHIIGKCPEDIQILFVAIFTDYLSNARPNLYIYTQTHSAGRLKNGNVEEEYNIFYSNSLNQHKRLTC